ncbi:WhiB family transcriptional regulator [Streptomyces sp. NPDC090106]|uniref:WhiB family transcriptional regulator n=1 Tax=Streptomyces sp. NPDC090106 TaxID=3365946 RepID=UPI003823996D
MDWRDEGLCLREDPDLFFPIGDFRSGVTALQIAEAKAVCGRCPVAGRCLSWAVDTGPVEGIWGGTTEGERRALRLRTMPRRTAGAPAAATEEAA